MCACVCGEEEDTLAISKDHRNCKKKKKTQELVIQMSSVVILI